MNLKVKTKLINTNSNDLAKQLNTQLINESAKAVKQELDNQLKGFYCDKHKNKTKGTITVVADLRKKIQIKYSDFCCSEFEKSIDITT